MASLLPPNRQNKKRKQRRAVERFEGEVLEYMGHLLKTKFSRVSGTKTQEDATLRKLPEITLLKEKLRTIRNITTSSGTISNLAKNRKLISNVS